MTLHVIIGKGPVGTALSELLAERGDEVRVISRSGGDGAHVALDVTDAERAELWTNALARHEKGRVRVTEARASDFIGPGVARNAPLSDRVMPRLLRGQQVRVLGDPDAPRSWTYVPDVAKSLATLADDERAWGRPWHVPTAPPCSQQAAVTQLSRIAGLEPKPVAAVPWWQIRLLGLFSPVVREVPELRYQFDAPFVVDSSAFTETFGMQPTSFDDALEATVKWWQQRLSDN